MRCTTYILIIQKRTSSEIALKTRTIFMEKGLYLYVGSAKRNMEQRLARHMRKEKKHFWHIDYVTAGKDVSLAGILLSSGDECETLQRVSALGLLFGRKLGSSDCGCRSHFVRVEGRNLVSLRRALMGHGFLQWPIPTSC